MSIEEFAVLGSLVAGLTVFVVVLGRIFWRALSDDNFKEAKQ
jgi:hypothetical protein